ncbi:MAG: UDP-N-acetylglucosamine--N-acetylmuramyl-(pentapeptide) pyrophosphoryl-undecaprenol N-acetylglucosamine transferase [bacterium]|nr:UDP-N-acetylglucosamine--N-acetylmuramyl-(pentapeptide) pyrophosphoryl-undecaprenol N-acetylglucosamine transferase [bacterium]
MKILFAGGGTGGHFYPIIAINRALRKIAEEEQLLEIKTVFLSTSPYDKELLRQEEIKFTWVPAGKMRRYFSILNFFDYFTMGIGVLKAILSIFISLPDVIFAKGGYASFPALVAGRFFRIPIIIHESDSVPGRVSMWASSFAKRIAISFPGSVHYFSDKKVALTGHPMWPSGILGGNAENAYATFGLQKGLPTLFVTGGSQGAAKINDTIASMLSFALNDFQIIHQTGKAHIKEAIDRASIILEKNNIKSRYHPIAYLNEAELRDLSQVVDVAVSRAGAGSIFMFAAWETPAIFIPLPHAAQDHQRENAYAYAHTGAGTVMEENNLTPHLLFEEIQHLIKDAALRKRMKAAAANFAQKDAAEKIAREIISLALEHSS